MENNEIIYHLISFLIVGLIFSGALAITFKILLKQYSVDNAKIKFYGLLLGLNNKQILSFSMASLNYIFLLYNLLLFNEVNIIFLTFTLILSIFSDVIIKNYPKGLLNIVYEIISILTIFVNNLLFTYLQDQSSIMVVICIIFVIILSALFYSFVLFKTLNNVIVKDKFIKEEKYSL